MSGIDERDPPRRTDDGHDGPAGGTFAPAERPLEPWGADGEPPEDGRAGDWPTTPAEIPLVDDTRLEPVGEPARYG